MKIELRENAGTTRLVSAMRCAGCNCRLARHSRYVALVGGSDVGESYYCGTCGDSLWPDSDVPEAAPCQPSSHHPASTPATASS
jgi:uncharacterized protein with PIN domain